MHPPQYLTNLRQLWARILDEEEDAIKDDDVFFDLGGDSLTASELIDAAEELGLKFTIEDLFNNPSLKSLATCISISGYQSSDTTLSNSEIDDVSTDEAALKTEFVLPGAPNSWSLTPRQKRLVDSGLPLESMRTWRRVQLNVEIPYTRIKQTFDDIVRAQPTCRARLNREAKDLYTVATDTTDISEQYRFRQSLCRNLSQVEIRNVEGESFDALDLRDGPVFSVDVYRSESGLQLFLAASSLLIDESSWEIILDDFDKAIESRSPLASATQGIWKLYQNEPTVIHSSAESEQKLAKQRNADSWGLQWDKNRPNISVSSAVDTGAEIEDVQRKLRDLSTEDALLHVLQTFAIKFGPFVSNIAVEKSRPQGLEHAVGNFQELSMIWAIGEAEIANSDHSHWSTLRQNIRRKLHEPRWVDLDNEESKEFALASQADLAIHVHLHDGRLRASSNYHTISNIQKPWDKPDDFTIAPNGFIEVYLSISVAGNPHTICIFDDRNRQAEGLRTWASDLWKNGYIATPFTAQGFKETQNSSVDGHGNNVNNEIQMQDLRLRTLARWETSSLDYNEALATQCDLMPNQITNVYPCTPMQESLAVEVGEDVNSYVMQLVFKMAHYIPMDRFKRAWEATVHANAVLRTRICRVEGSNSHVQVVTTKELQWQHARLKLAQFLDRDASDPMSLGQPFFRYTIVEECDDKDADDKSGLGQHYFVWTVHHALCDGASISLILDEVSKRFQHETPRERQPFESFIRSPAIMPDPSRERAFWEKSLSELDPTPYPQIPQTPDFRAAPASILERPLTLDKFPPYGITKALFLRAVWAILMSHYTGTEDVCFGAINSGRTAAVTGVSHMTGPTINVTPVSLHITPQEAVGSFFSRFRAKAAEMIPFEHSGVSKIRKFLTGSHPTATNFQTLFVVHPRDFTEEIGPASKELGIEYLELGKREKHPYPLVLTLTLSSTAVINLHIQYDQRVVSTQQAHTLVHHFQTLLTSLSSSRPDTLLESISPLSNHDIAQIGEWNKCTPAVEETCIDWLFHAHVVKQPNAIAVCSTEQSLTYSEVETYASSFAARLIDLGVHPGNFVGVCFEKSIWTVVAIMGVFKAGAIYVPIDPAHPQGRIKEVVDTVQIKVALASPSGAKVLEGLCPQLIIVDQSPFAPVEIAPPSRSTPFSTAYLLFTSGSTGKPKGLLMSHSAICTSIIHHGASFGAGPHWRTFQFCAHTFDISIAEFFTTLAYGGCICVPSEHDRLNDLSGAITALRANTLLVVPTVANILHPKDVPTVKTLVVSGEPVTKETIARWAAHVDLTCAYGPSETAVWCSGNLRVSPEAHPSNIGRNIGGTMWIANADNYHQLSAIGCVGEIVISGAIVGEGYFGDKAITDSAFVPAPDWLKKFDPANPYDKIYKSGDLARYNSDGTLHIVGRLNTQVKLRGFRIELGEIENQIMTTGAVTAALAALPKIGPCAGQIVVVVSSTRFGLEDHSGNDGIVLSKESQLVIHKLRAHLQLVLPGYMVPTVWIVVDRLPLLISGKLDRKAILSWIHAIDIDTYNNLTQEPEANSTSEIIPGSLADALRRLWSEVLNTPSDRIGMQTSFFSLGGDSLTAMRVASRAKALGLPSITARTMIRTNTLGNLVNFVGKSKLSDDSSGLNKTDAPDMGQIIDWEAETALQLPPLLTHPQRPQGNEKSVRKAAEGELQPTPFEIPCDERPKTPRSLRIIITGATGFFGRAITRMLQRHPSVGKVHCLAVRDTNSTAAQNLVHSCPKAQLHAGDLSQARLGLDKDEARLIFAEADAIIHNGAEVSFLKPYEALRDANVGSTRELVKLSLEFGRTRFISGRKTLLPSIHYVSGTGVAALALLPSPSEPTSLPQSKIGGAPDLVDPADQGKEARDASPETTIIKPDSLLSRAPPSVVGPVVVGQGKMINIDGYVSSKWASEALLEKATMDEVGAALGLAAHIYRLSNITGPDAPELDLIHNILRVSRAMKTVPKLTGWSGWFDFIRADTAADALVERLVQSLVPGRQGGTRIVIRNTNGERQHLHQKDSKTRARGSIEFLHLTGESVVPIPELKAHMERETQDTFGELGLEDWLAEATKFGLPELLAAFLSTLGGDDSGTGPFLPHVESSLY